MPKKADSAGFRGNDTLGGRMRLGNSPTNPFDTDSWLAVRRGTRHRGVWLLLDSRGQSCATAPMPES